MTVHVFMQMYIDKDISTYEGPIAVLYKTCKKYNLMDIVYNELFSSATPMSSTRWKKCVYNSVSQQQIARWNGRGCIFYSCSCDNVRHLQICSLCDSYDKLTVAHALLSCAGLGSLRSVSWAAVTQSMPGPLAESLGSPCDNEKMIMLLSGLNCPYITEWQVIYEDIITFLATMYTKFKANLDRLWSKWFPRAVHYTLKCHSNHQNLSHFGVRVGPTPAGPVHWPCVGPILGQRRRLFMFLCVLCRLGVVSGGVPALCQFLLLSHAAIFHPLYVINVCICIWYVFQ